MQIWNEEEDKPRLAMIGQHLLEGDPILRLKVYPGEENPEHRYIYIVVPGEPPKQLFACVVPPGESIDDYMRAWVTELFPGTPVPAFDVSVYDGP